MRANAYAGNAGQAFLPRLKNGSLRPLFLKLYDLKMRVLDARLRATAATIARKYRPFTMIPRRRFIDNLLLAASVRHLPGCVIECGVWRGGMSAGLAEILGPERHYYLFDSFEGLPPAQEIDGRAALRWQSATDGPSYYDNCRAELEFSERAMALAKARHVMFRKGWFSETLPGFVPDSGIAVLRLDGDWYESTMQCLEALYLQVVPGGLIIIDDYYTWEGCTKAIHDFLSSNDLPDRIRQTPAGVCYIVRSSTNSH